MAINLNGQTATEVGIQYFGVAAGTTLVFKNTSTGAATPSGSDALMNGGDGTAEIPYPAGLPAGDYCLVAQLGDEWAGQTVKFYYNGPPPEMPP